MTTRILVMEDETRMRRLLDLVLTKAGYQVRTAADGRQGLACWRQWRPDAVITDLKMPQMDGLQVLAERNARYPEIPLIVLTAFGTVDTAVAAMKDGAFDYLTKPVDNRRLLEIVALALAESRPTTLPDDEMVGESASMQRIRKEIAMVCRSNSAVLVTGESGTGKELVAKAIHRSAGGQDAPFIRVNCPSIPADLLESELFGHCRGAFTGAVQNRSGAFLQADGGILFLDEIGDLPLPLQPKLLHAVERKAVTPVGGDKMQRVSVRIVSATNRNLRAMVDEDRFRRDLYFRLNTFHIHLPPLRERPADILPLAEHFLAAYCRHYQKRDQAIHPQAAELLRHYPWPGNIRELRSIMERTCLKAGDGEIRPPALPERIRKAGPKPTDRSAAESSHLADHERRLIVEALTQSGWNQSKAARQLGITRNTLRYRMHKYDLRPPG